MYMFKELDKLQLDGTFTGDRLKKFYPCQQSKLDHTPNLDHKKIPTFDYFLAGDSNSKLFAALINYFWPPQYTWAAQLCKIAWL